MKEINQDYIENVKCEDIPFSFNVSSYYIIYI